MTGREQAVESSKVYVKEMAGICQLRVESWIVPPESSPVTTFPVHVTHFVGNMYKDEVLFEK